MSQDCSIAELLRQMGELKNRVGRLEGEMHVILILIGATLAGVVALVVKAI
ncbi:MAG: hypothetical protein V1924_05030 [Candidatus Bathyarchaeota archaeon]